MKQFLILLNSIITLTISSSTFANLNQNTTFTYNLKTNNNDNKNLLINNKYGDLSDSDWITNQSTIDHKFYSYDTSDANYLLSDGKTLARTLFIVDNDGNLTYKKDVIIPAKDKVDIENTKQEMISHKKVNTIKDDYNPYSKSEYSTSYFVGDNNWQYIQQGGVEKHIDISQQAGANKVENSNNLSEIWGLYYIAKAGKENKISQAVADNLGQYFINQSTLKEQISDKLTATIINFIINNKDIYNFLLNVPIKINDKNYSLNWIFDSNNQLVAVYYNQFNKSNVENNLNYHYYYWTYFMFGTVNDSSDTYNLLNWKKYARDWDTFIKIFPTFVFDKDSYVNLSVMSHGSSKFTNLKTNDILTNQGEGNTNSLYNISFPYMKDRYHFKEIFDLNIWHDNENIYFKWFLCGIEGGSEYTINLNNINFINIIN